MRQHTTATVLRGVKTSLFLLAVIGASTLLSLSSPRPAQAEGLLYGLTCTVGGLLGRSCERAPESPAPPPPASGGTNNETDQPTSGGSVSPASPAPTTQALPSPDPVELNQELLDEMPAIASADSVNSRYTFPAHVAPVLYTGDTAAVLGQSATGPIEASQHGWKILGVSWVWWLAMIALVGAGVYFSKRIFSYRKASRVAKS